MKVLHVIDALGLGGGAEHALAGMLPRLRERGVDSSVVCLIPREGGLQARLREEGFEVTVLESTSLLGRVRALRRIVRGTQPDVVHATLFTSCLVARLACVGLPVGRLDSLVNTSYDPVRIERLAVPKWKLWVVRQVDGFTARRFSGHFHALTDPVRDEAVEVLGVEPARVTVIPRGRSAADLGERTPERRREVRERLNIDQDVPVLLNVGRQDRQKAQDDLVRAFALVRLEHPSALLLIAGREGDGSSELQAATSECDTGDAVRLLGHRDDVHDLYAAADLFVFPSHYEGLGSALIEAMAGGLPVVASDAPAVEEVLGGGRYGQVVRRGNVVALGNQIAQLLSSEPDRRALSEAGRERFETCYELGSIVDAMIDLYRQSSRQV